jgi:hypothetical protein
MSDRPYYENEKDLTIEREVVTRICEKWKCEAHKLPISYFFDYGLTKSGSDQLGAVVEIKRRNVNKDTYPDIILSLNKVMKGREYQRMNIKPWFVVMFNDGIYFHRISANRPYYVGYGGRTDRSDPQDMEPVAHIPIEAFRELE